MVQVPSAFHYNCTNFNRIVTGFANASITPDSSRPAISSKTAPRQNFINGEPEIVVRCVNPPNSSYISTFAQPIPEGTTWIELVVWTSASKCTPTVWIFNKGGYLNAAALGLSSAYQADYNIQPLLRNNSGVIQYYDTYADNWINV